jgi:hypothetical protein
MRSIPIPEFYRIWHGRLLQEVPDECDSRLTNLIWLMMGIYLAGSVQLDLIARKVPIRAKKLSIVKRLQRFLDNAAVRVRTWYAATALGLIQAAAAGGQVRLIIDGSKVSFGHQLLMVAIAYHRRALPLAGRGFPIGEATAVRQNRSSCWPMYRICCRSMSRACWSVTVNSGIRC